MSWDWDKLKNRYDKERETIKPKKEFEVRLWLIYVIYAIVTIALVASFWFLGRWAHYKFSYKNKVEKQIIQMVKPEALKEEYRK